MSQIVNAIKEHDTGNRKMLNDSFTPLFRDMVDLKSTLEPVEIGYQYRIDVRLGCDVIINDGEIAEAVKRTKNQVIEAVFGEFRGDFMMLERAIYDRDFHASKVYLEKLRHNMYGVE